MKIAITGANGFVGSNLVKHFLSAGYEVRAIVRSNAFTTFISSRAQIVKVNYYDAQSLISAFTGIDIIIHNAGKTKALNSEQMFKANLGITEKIIEAINKLPEEQQLIYFSSQAASRPSIDNIPVKEDEPSAPVTWYGKSKLLRKKPSRKNAGRIILLSVPVQFMVVVIRIFYRFLSLLIVVSVLKLGVKIS